MSGLSTLNSNSRFLSVVILAGTLVFSADWFLYQRRGFLTHYGYRTQDGQVLEKLDRSKKLAEVSDVLFFGSSMVRSNISSKPFVDAGVLPLNMGISGGGPITSYYVLRSLAPVLRRRSSRPVIVLEVMGAAFLKDPEQGWPEYEHIFALLRSRGEVLADAPLLYRHFRDFQMTSVFLSTALLLSLMYREQGRSLGSLPVSSWRSLLEFPRGQNSHFVGVEDAWGYSPLYEPITLHPEVESPRTNQAIRADEISAVKLRYLRMAVELGRAVGSRVVLLEAVADLLEKGRPEDAVYASIKQDFPDVQVIRARDIGYRPDDFAGVHLSIWGADRYSSRLIALLGLTRRPSPPQPTELSVLEKVPLPPVRNWTVIPGVATPVGTDTFVMAAGRHEEGAATSPPIAVMPGGHYVFEFEAGPLTGPMAFYFGSVNGIRNGLPEIDFAQVMSADQLPPNRVSVRYYLRFTPSTAQAALRLMQFSRLAGTRVRILSLYRNR